VTREELAEALSVERFTHHQRTGDPEPLTPGQRRRNLARELHIPDDTSAAHTFDSWDNGTQRDRPVRKHPTVSDHSSLRDNERG
jgi:hypothetical protein